MTKILIVEDSPTQALQLASMLEKQGYETQIAVDGNSALEALNEVSVDLILSDIVMPGISGYEFCKKIKTQNSTKDLPVILVSGFTNPMEIIYAIECGAENFTSKPFQVEVLLKRIKDVLVRTDLKKNNMENINEIYFMGSTFNLISNPKRALELLLSSFEDTVRINTDLQENKEILQEERIILGKEQERSEVLLLNILPKDIAERLKNSREVIADKYSDISILFADIVGYTKIAMNYSAQELVSILNTIFSKFDDLVEKFGVEKIKTVGDAYMVASGLPKPRPDHAKALANLAIEMLEQLAQFDVEYGKSFHMRIGINSGSAVAGVIGHKKFLYDIWGDTVNIASRMESHGLPDCIQVSNNTYQLIKDDFLFENRGEIYMKGKGMMTCYFLKGRK